jgi:beta-N-acetylglucosaminidase
MPKKKRKSTPKRHAKKKNPPIQMSSHRKIRWILAIAALFMLLIFASFKLSETGIYSVYDPSISQEAQASYKHLFFARFKMQELSSQAYIQNEDGKVVSVACGFAVLNTKEESVNTEFIYEDSKESGYLNGNYAFDGLYIKTNRDASKVLVEISGARIWLDLDDIWLESYQPEKVSSYYAYDSSLYHRIQIDPYSGIYYDIQIGPAYDFMEENTLYYSYDGQYFYEDYEALSFDARQESHAKALNHKAAQNPYQYMSHEESIDLDAAKVDAYLASLGLIQPCTSWPCADDASVLVGSYDLFKQVENETGISAAMMFALALNESGYGQSEFAVLNKNLFGHAAYDQDPSQATVYDSLYECISNHAVHFIGEIYDNPDSAYYAGSWFGDKASGMNVHYASDPYWGEKAAGFLYRLVTYCSEKQI